MNGWNSTLARHKGLEVRKALARKTALKPVNRDRRAKLHARNFGTKGAWIRSLPCCVTGITEADGFKIDAAHTKARGIGGCGGDLTHLVPLWRPVHRSFDTDTDATFQRLWMATKEDVRAAAQALHKRWLEEIA